MKKICSIFILSIFFCSIFIFSFSDGNYNSKVVIEYDSGTTENLSVFQDGTEQVRDVLDSGAQLVLRLAYNEAIPNPYEALSSGIDVDQLIKIRRNESKKFHSDWNSFLSKGMGVTEEKNYYSSSYAPFITISVEGEDALSVMNKAIEYSRYSAVETVYIVENSKTQNEMVSSSVAINLDDVKSIYPSLDGSGVKIGILESLGIIDEDNANFTSLDNPPVVRNTFFYTEHVTQHATLVASIAGGSTGVAPGAQMYSVELYLPSNTGIPVKSMLYLIMELILSI